MNQTAPTPHRAYRRLNRPALYGTSALAGLLIYIAASIALIPYLTDWHFRLTRLLLGDYGDSVTATRLGPWHLNVVSLNVLYLTPSQLLLGALVSGVVLLAVTQLKTLPLWLRHLLGLLAAISLANTLFLAAFPSQFLSGDALSTLYIRTQVLVWLVLPIVAWLAAVSVVLPRGYWLALPLVWLALDFVLSVVRFAGWAVLLRHLGPTISPLLYFFTGPLLDALNLVGVFSVILFIASSRLSGQEKKWSWL